MIGRQLGRYQVVSKIGAGGMGEVYLGEDTRLNRPVAIKVLAGGGEIGAGDRKQLEREAAAMSRLNHPNIATVYDFNQVDDIDYLVMEYVEGETLAARLCQGELREDDVRRWGSQIASALAEAHALGVLHRDIKPHNIMITQQDQAKVLDFGLAKLSRGERSIASTLTATATAAGSILGTIPYMAPESLAGKPATAQTDIFALGAVLYEMATGRRAFKADTSPQVIDQILHEEPPAVTALNRQMSPDLERCIEKCLDKQPEHRYQAAREVSVDLQRVDGQTGLSAGRARATTPSKRRWWRFAIPAIPLVAAAVWAVIWFGSAEPALSFAARDWILVADFENQTGDTRYDAAIQTALLASLEQSTRANIYPRARVAGVLRRMGRENDLPIDEELGREICVRADIRGLVTASIGRVGQRFALSAQLIDPTTGERVRSYVEHAEGEDEILETLESISKSLRRDLGESLASIQQHNAPLLEITTPSLDALRLFAEGLAAWRHIEPDLAMELLQQALVLDPDFAMAHAALGAHYYSHIYNDTVKGEYHYQRALELVDRVTERERRVIETEFASHRDHIDEARRLYRAYLTLYPDDLGMQQGFAKLLMSDFLFEESAAVYVEVLRIEPDDAGANINFGVCQAGLGNYESALASYEKAFEIEPTWRDWGNLNHEYGFIQAELGLRQEARRTFEHAAEVGPGNHGPHRSLGLLALYEGKIGEARQHFEKAIELAQGDDMRLSRSRNYLFASLASLCAGDLESRIDELHHASQLLGELGPSPTWWSRTGVELARCGEFAEAEGALRKIEEQLDPENDAHQASLLRLRAELALGAGDFAGTIELLEASLLRYQSPATMESIALAYAQSGNSNEAVVALRAFVDDPAPPLGWEPQVRWQEAHVLLAAMYVERDQPELAVPLLDFILECWSAADPDFALATEARMMRERI